ncbi:hypothetical protein GW17_00061916, partial [Ensete ventricosum]
RLVFRVCASKLASDESLGRQHMGAVYHQGSSQIASTSEEATTSPVGLSYPKTKRRLERRWTRRSTTVPQRRIYRSRRKGCRCKATDSRAIGLAAPWYVEAGLPWSHRSFALMEGEHWS